MKSQNLHLNRKRLAACNTPNLLCGGVLGHGDRTGGGSAGSQEQIPRSRSPAQDGLHRPSASSFRLPATPACFRLVHGLKLTAVVPTACPQKCIWGILAPVLAAQHWPCPALAMCCWAHALLCFILISSWRAALGTRSETGQGSAVVHQQQKYKAFPEVYK